MTMRCDCKPEPSVVPAVVWLSPHFARSLSAKSYHDADADGEGEVDDDDDDGKVDDDDDYGEVDDDADADDDARLLWVALPMLML